MVIESILPGIRKGLFNNPSPILVIAERGVLVARAGVERRAKEGRPSPSLSHRERNITAALNLPSGKGILPPSAAARSQSGACLWQGVGSWSGFGPSAPFLFGGTLALIAALMMIYWMPKTRVI